MDTMVELKSDLECIRKRKNNGDNEIIWHEVCANVAEHTHKHIAN